MNAQKNIERERVNFMVRLFHWVLFRLIQQPRWIISILRTTERSWSRLVFRLKIVGLYFKLMRHVLRNAIGLFRDIKIQLERETTKSEGKWMIRKYFSHSFQRVSIGFVITASLSIWILDISKMAYRPYSYSQYWIGTSLQWRLMRGNMLKTICICRDFPALASIAS